MPTSEIHFWHIPKTAGTSVAGMIRRAYPSGESIPAHTARELLVMSAADVPNYRCYTGHFFSLLEPLVGRPLPTATILRDPVEQTLSMLAHCQQHVPGAGLAGPLVARVLPFVWEKLPSRRHSIEKRWCPVLMNNFQTRVLGSEIRVPDSLPRNFYGMTYPFLDPDFCSPSADLEALYERAVERLESMAVVGTAERLPETVRLIFKLLGMEPPQQLAKDNIGAKRQAPSLQFLEMVSRENFYDIRLHRFAAEMLQNKLISAFAPQAERDEQDSE